MTGCGASSAYVTSVGDDSVESAVLLSPAKSDRTLRPNGTSSFAPRCVVWCGSESEDEEEVLCFVAWVRMKVERCCLFLLCACGGMRRSCWHIIQIRQRVGRSAGRDYFRRGEKRKLFYRDEGRGGGGEKEHLQRDCERPLCSRRRRKDVYHS